jgi:uncharacterized OB-fold protein
MTLLKRVRDLIGEDGTVHECRRCGATLEPGVDTCPQCGKSDIATYEV